MVNEFLQAARSGESLADFIEQLDAEGRLAELLPEIKALQGFEHSPLHHPEGHVWTHVMLCVRASESTDPTINLAILFHDIGKAVTHSRDERGDHYYGHEAAGVPLFEAVARRLGLSAEQQAAIEFAMANHMLGHQIHKINARKVIALRQDPHWNVLYHVTKADEKVRLHLWDPAAFEQKMAKADLRAANHERLEEHEQRLTALIDGRLILSLVPAAGPGVVGAIKKTVRSVIEARNFDISATEVRELILRQASKLTS